MSNVPPEGRSFRRITDRDLTRLAEFATDQRADFFRRRPDWAKLYSRRVLLRGEVGINDFDVYTFYAQHPKRPWYAKSLSIRDFGDPKFVVNRLRNLASSAARWT